MARGDAARAIEDAETGPDAGLVALSGEVAAQSVASLRQLLRRPADGMPAHQGGRRLSERAGLHFLAHCGDPPLPVEGDVDSDAAATQRRTLLHARLRPLETPEVRDRSGEAEYVAAVDG